MSSFQDWVPLLGHRGRRRRGQGDEEQNLLPSSGSDAQHGMSATDAACEAEAERDQGRRAGFMASDVPASTNPIAHSRTWHTSSEQTTDPQVDKFGHGPDRGHGYYAFARERDHKPSLVSIGRHAGRSRVRLTGFRGLYLFYHLWKRDFFVSCINVRLPFAIVMMALGYTTSFLFWGCCWFALYKYDSTCLSGFEDNASGFVSAFQFATETQQTIGYGFRAPNDCWASAWLVVVQSIWGQLLDAIVLGVIFARISHPKQRARTVFMSDSAVIARRDGILKFMFRVGDIRQTQVVAPNLRAFLYTWGPGRVTGEGEHIPVRMEPLQISDPNDLLLLLPVTAEHTIDERSPLFGHTHESLTAVNAEIVVVLDGTTEHGDQFMSTRSYLPSEVHWGFTFVPIVKPAQPPSNRHEVDIGRFHEIEPQEGRTLSRGNMVTTAVTCRPKRCIPYPLLHENTLLLSDNLVVNIVRGRLRLMFRVGDVYPDNMVEVHVRAYLYRWHTKDEHEVSGMNYEVDQLDLGYQQGNDRLLLRFPLVITHVIDHHSPLRAWQSGPSALAADADSEIVVVVEAYKFRTSENMLFKRVYGINSTVKWGHRFVPIVRRSSARFQNRPTVAWTQFHDTTPVQDTSSIESGRPSRATSTTTSRPGSPGRDARYPDRPSSPFGSAEDLGRAHTDWQNQGRTRQDGLGSRHNSLAQGQNSQHGHSRSVEGLDENTISNTTVSSPGHEWTQRRSLFSLPFYDPQEPELENTPTLTSMQLARAPSHQLDQSSRSSGTSEQEAHD